MLIVKAILDNYSYFIKNSTSKIIILPVSPEPLINMYLLYPIHSREAHQKRNGNFCAESGQRVQKVRIQLVWSAAHSKRKFLFARALFESAHANSVPVAESIRLS